MPQFDKRQMPTTGGGRWPCPRPAPGQSPAPSLPSPTRHIQSPRRLCLPESVPRPGTSMPARHQPNRISGCSRECLPTTTHCRGSSASADHRLESAESIQRLTEFEMKLKFARLSTAILGCAAALVFPASVASADPPDPHQPDMTKGYCPGGRWGLATWPCATARSTPTARFDTSGCKRGLPAHSFTSIVSAAVSPSPARRHRVVAVGQFRPSSPTLPDGWASAHILNDEPVAFRQS